MFYTRLKNSHIMHLQRLKSKQNSIIHVSVNEFFYNQNTNYIYAQTEQ